MSNAKTICLTVAFAMLLSGAAHAAFTYQPTPADMYNLDHARYYTWGIDLGFSSADTPITEMTMSFAQITNYIDASNVLYLHLLDNTSQTVGVTASADSRQDQVDAFEGQGVLIDAWRDLQGGEEYTENLTYNFGEWTVQNSDGDSVTLLSVLNEYATDGYIAFGLDPDCHYWNEGITLDGRSLAIPAPGALVLASIGLSALGLGWLRKRKAN